MGITIAIIASLLIGYGAYHIAQRRSPDAEDDYYEYKYEPEEPEYRETYFDYLTVSEQFAKAKITNDSLLMMQRLMSDLAFASIDSQMVIQISWSDSDGKSNTYDLYCDGMNTNSECIQRIAKRETAELKHTLSDQCQRLARSVQGSDPTEKIPDAARKIFENGLGEGLESDGETLSDVRSDD